MLEDVENWLPVVGYEGLYEVSDLGHVRSVERLSRAGIPIGGRVLRAGPQRRGYLTVCLIGHDGSKKSKRVHRLVLESFTGPCPEAFEVRHLNDIPGDNRLSNLVWGSRSENQRDKHRNGRYGIDHTFCHICDKELSDTEDYYRSPANGLRACLECRPSWREAV